MDIYTRVLARIRRPANLSGAHTGRRRLRVQSLRGRAPASCVIAGLLANVISSLGVSLNRPKDSIVSDDETRVRIAFGDEETRYSERERLTRLENNGLDKIFF